MAGLCLGSRISITALPIRGTCLAFTRRLEQHQLGVCFVVQNSDCKLFLVTGAEQSKAGALMLPLQQQTLRVLRNVQPRQIQCSFNVTEYIRHQYLRSWAPVNKPYPLTTPGRSHHVGSATMQTRWMHSSRGEGATLAKENRHTAFVAFGSNLGDRISNIEQALDAMRSHGLSIIKISNMYETTAMYYEDQGNFLNGVCMVGLNLCA